VIIYTYIGYNVWDIPLVYSATLGNKYGYAVRRTYFTFFRGSFLLLTNPYRADLQSHLGSRQNLHPALPFAFDLPEKGGAPSPLGTINFQWPHRYRHIFYHCFSLCTHRRQLGRLHNPTRRVSTLQTSSPARTLPTWIVYRLQMQWNQKLMLIGILSFGLL